MSRTLIVHAGGGKAGSSAIQSALASSVTELSEIGISYSGAPAASSPYEISSGNGYSIFEALAKPDWEARSSLLLESYLSGHSVGVCSSEHLGRLSEGNWHRLLSAASSISIDVKVVYFVRSPLDYIAASYNQAVKRGGEIRTIDEASLALPWHHHDELIILDRVFSDRKIKVINYDANRRNITDAFAYSWPELHDVAGCLAKFRSTTVNRALSPFELEMLRRINALLGAASGTEISDMLIRDNPELHTRTSLPENIAATLETKHTESLRWVNARFLRCGGENLKSRSGQCIEQADDTGHAQHVQHVQHLVLDWALNKMAARVNDITSIYERLLDIDWQHSSNPKIPLDFDPVAYLLVNEDLLRSGTRPYAHYLSHGRVEDRQYTWPLALDASLDGTTAESVARLRMECSNYLSDVPVWLRMRHLLQTHSLLDPFVQRERLYVDELRRSMEKNSFDVGRAQLAIETALRPFACDLQAIGDEVMRGFSGVFTFLRASADEGDVRLTSLDNAANRILVLVENDNKLLLEERDHLLRALELKNKEISSLYQQIESHSKTGILDYILNKVRRRE